MHPSNFLHTLPRWSHEFLHRITGRLVTRSFSKVASCFAAAFAAAFALAGISRDGGIGDSQRARDALPAGLSNSAPLHSCMRMLAASPSGSVSILRLAVLLRSALQ